MPDTADAGDLHLATVVVNVTDMDRAVAFWTAAMGYRTREPQVDPEFTTLVDPEGRHRPVSLQIADQIPSTPTPVRLDLYTSRRDEHVDRLVELGATRTAMRAPVHRRRCCSPIRGADDGRRR